MIIDLTYFEKEPVFLPNISSNPNAGVNNNALYEGYVNQFEFDFLLNALGYELTVELLGQFETNGDWKLDALQKWKDLVDGLGNWRGLRFTQTGRKYSPIANYVYCQILYLEETKQTAVGNSTNNISGGNVVSNWYNIVPVWRELVQMYQGRNNNGIVSLETFLRDNSTDYPDYKFNHFQNINTFNL